MDASEFARQGLRDIPGDVQECNVSGSGFGSGSVDVIGSASGFGGCSGSGDGYGSGEGFGDGRGYCVGYDAWGDCSGVCSGGNQV